MKITDAVQSLAALAQETRLELFRLLVEQGPEGMTAGRIAEKLRVPPATLSFHLKELANAKLVRARQEGRFIYYSADFHSMNGLVAYLTENCCRASYPTAECATPARATCAPTSSAKRRTT